jgi:hypothetical protein
MQKVQLRLLTSVLWSIVVLSGCSSPPAIEEPAAEEEHETLARTEFTGRIENFFEYEALRGGMPSQFLIHLTDLSDGTPVEKADVTLYVRPAGSSDAGTEIKALVGRVTGIYVATVAIPSPGDYDIEFHVKNEKLDERLPLSGFKVE